MEGSKAIKSRLRLAALIGSLLLAMTWRCHAQTTQPAPPSPGSKRILLLYSYGYGGKGVRIFDDGFLAVVGDAGVSANEIHCEFLDLGRPQEDSQYIPQLQASLLSKYATHQIDLIITVQQPALGFLLDQGRQLAPGAPVITLQSPLLTEAQAQGRQFLCQLSPFDIKGTLQWAMELFPATQRVVFVSGSSDADKKMAAAAAAAASAWQGKLEFEYTADLALPRMLQRVSSLPPHTIIIFTQYNRDTDGRATLAYEVEGQITKVANAPVFGLYDFNLSNDGIGGSVISVRSLGESTARAALDILHGKLQLKQPVTAINNHAVPIFDWRQIQRWGGAAGNLPGETIFLHRPPSLWEQYRMYVIAAAAALAAQSFLIVAMLVNHQRRHWAERSLRESEQRFRILVEQAPEAIVVLDFDRNCLVDANSKAERLFECDREQLLQSGLERFYVPQQPDEQPPATSIRENCQQALAGESVLFERTIHTAGGKDITCEVRVVRLPAAGRNLLRGSFIDITERKQMEQERLHLQEQLRQAQKMEAVGQLAGGVAHDFNNLLTPIMGYADMLVTGLPADNRHLDYDRQILHAAERARDLNRQLLAFSRRQMLQFKTVDLRQVVLGFEKMLRRTIRENIHIDLSLPPALGFVRADVGHIEQVLMNLAVNAQDAMPDGGALSIGLQDITRDDTYTQSHAGTAPGPYVLLTVSDTGCGMDPQTLSHLFEPFFTTKEKGRGTGLGLATVYGIIKQHGGHVDVYSEPGRGTTFNIAFQQVRQDQVIEDESSAPPPPHAGQQPWTILLMEDDQGVRQMTDRMLRSNGYNVLTPTTVEQCIEMAQSRATPIDMLLTDVIMPTMNGRQLYERLRSDRPDLKILYMSGYAHDIIAHHGVIDQGVQFIQKPFAAATMLKKVHQVLAGS